MANQSERDSVDIGAVLDGARFRGLPALVMVCTAGIMILDGFDIQAIGFAAPAIAAELGIERSDLAPVFAAALIGMAVGSFILGPWGDRYGRKPAILISTVSFGLATPVTAFASSVTELTVLRFVTGIGLGGALPNSTALMAEFAPPRVRGQAIAAAIVGVPVGGIVGAAVAAEIIPAFGWESIFIVGGILPLLAAGIIYLILPESPRYLAAHPDRWRELAGILNLVVKEARFTGGERFVLTSHATADEALGQRNVFSGELLRDSIAVWIIFSTNAFAVYCFFNWAPTVLTSLGVDLATAVRGSLVFNTAGVLGALTLSWLIARTGSRWPQTILGATGALTMVFISQLVDRDAPISGTIGALMAGFAVAGFCVNTVQVTMYAVGAHVYPTACRAAGMGWALGMARLGGVLSAFAGAIMLTRGGASGFFVVIAGVLAVTAAAVLTLRRHLPPAGLPSSAIAAADDQAGTNVSTGRPEA